MKMSRNNFKWIGMVFLFATFLSFTFLLPSVFAQGENPSTPTPYEAPPAPEVTAEPFVIEIQLEEDQSLSQMQSNPESSESWSGQVNISNTAGESSEPKIAADVNGVLHLVWRETASGGKQEIFYSWLDDLTQSIPINVSNSPSFHSSSPEVVVDSDGIVHIVWKEEDNTHADDYEILYSKCERIGNGGAGYEVVCTSPAILSNGQPCSSYSGDWKGIDPSIGIDGNDNLMVAWMSYEPNPKNHTMYSLWPASGSPPSNRTGCHVSSGLANYPTVGGDANGNFHLALMNTSLNIFYSKYAGGNWSADQNIGTGSVPALHVDQNNKVHVAWQGNNAPPKYRSKEGSSTTWSATENVFASTICGDFSLITDGDDLPQLACANGAIIEGSRQSNGWVESIIVPNMAAQPDLAKDASGNLHLVWSDSSLGNWEISYSNLVSGCTPDIFEPDDLLSTGNPITLGEEQRHSLCPQGDEDWVNFQSNVTFPEHRNFLIETFDLEPDDINPNGNTQITVKDEFGNQIGTNQDRGFGPPPGSNSELETSRVVWHPATNGIFNIRVFPETPINEQAGSGYSLRLANPFTSVDPVDQASWSPTRVSVPAVWRNGNVVYFTQYFTYEQAELDALINLDATLAWEFRRPDVNDQTGNEIGDTNVDFGDYLKIVDINTCKGEYWTNLPSATDKFSEEKNGIYGCYQEPSFRDEEFELYVDDPGQLDAGKVYYITLKFYIHDEYLNNEYQFYLTKTEYCILYKGYDYVCNLRKDLKGFANLIEGYLQSTP